MNKLIAAALLSASFAAPAYAQDFTGPRIEAHVGWDQVGLDASYDDGFDTYRADGSKSGVAYGIGVGYDFSLSPGLIVGVEANFDLSDTKKCGEVYGDDALCLKTKRDLDVGVRLGQQFGNALIYAKVGYANGKIKASYVDYEGILDSVADSDTRGGLRLGAGVEAALGTGAYVKAEYRYTDYKKWTYSEPGFGTVGLDFDRHQILAGVGYRF